MAWAGNSGDIFNLLVLSSDHFWRLGKRLKHLNAQIIVGTIIHMKIEFDPEKNARYLELRVTEG
jgi:hypothetical protein